MSPQLVFVASLAIVLSLAGTFLARAVALRVGLLDRPSRRKVHTKPVPVLGGIAIYVAFMVTVLLTDPGLMLEDGIVVLVAATLLVGVGIIDDRRGVAPRAKLVAQVIAAVLLVVGGIGVTIWPFAWLNVATTVVWVVGICNAMNLLDNMDGLAAGVAAIACAAFVLLAATQGEAWVAMAAAALLGAVVGYLRFNWHPATIFMGDAGSLLLGFLLAVMALEVRFPGVDPGRAWPIPILVLGVPVFDTTLVTLSRLRRGIPVSSGGKDHVSHRLVRLGLGVRQAVGALYLAALLCGGAAMLLLQLPTDESFFGVGTLIVLGGLTAMFLLERVDLSDTGQGVPGEEPAAREPAPS